MDPSYYDVVGDVPDVPGIAIVTGGASRTTRGTGQKALAIIGDPGWGPRGVVYSPSSGQDLWATFFPFGPDANGAFAELAGVKMGAVKFYRPNGTSGVKATVTIQDGQGSPANSLKVTAKQEGAAGNHAKVVVTANADDATARDVRIYCDYTDSNNVTRIGYDKTYRAVQTSDGTVTDPGDPYFTLAKASGATHAAAAGTYSLSTGASGTVAATDYAAGFNAFNGDTSVEVFVCIGVPSGVRADVNAAITVWAESADRAGRCAVLCTPAATDAATAITNAGTWASRGVRYLWPRVAKTAYYSYNGLSVKTTGTVDGALLYAACLQRLQPHDSPFASTWGDLHAAAGYTALESGYAGASKSTMASLSAAGVIAWTIDKDFGGLTPADDLTTGTASGAIVRGFAQRYADWLGNQLATAAKQYLSKPLDIDLGAHKLGPYSTRLYGAFKGILKSEQDADNLVGGLNADGTVSPAFAVDMFGGQNPDDLAAGKSTVIVSARITPNLRVLILLSNVGTVVDIASSTV